MVRATMIAAATVGVGLGGGHAWAGDVSSPDPSLAVTVIDTAPTESFLAIKADTTGRLFVGGREALFVYEPDGKGGYTPRVQLLALPNHTWVHDIEIRGDDLYFLTVNGLYLVPQGRVKREGLQAQRLVWGVPRGHVHQCFHGMTQGPEGDLYLAMGDPLWYYGNFARPDHWGHWTFYCRRPSAGGGMGGGVAVAEADPASAEGWEKIPYVGVGAVFRCRPDGSGLEVVAGGLRNDCGLAFDRDWNLFTADNDHESMPGSYVPGRLVHVAPEAYFSWPRGWMPEKTPDRLDLLATMNPDLGRFVPVDVECYDDTHLPDRYRNSLLVARWCSRQVTFYPLEHAGATFRAQEGELLAGVDLARPVHVEVGRGGRVFASVCFMAHNEGSPVYKSELVMVTRADDPADHPFDAYDAAAATAERLFAELANASLSRRKVAHVELLRRSDIPEAALLERFDRARPQSVERPNLLWLVAMKASEPAARERLTRALTDPDPAIRLQAVRAMAQRFPGAARDTAMLLADPDPKVRHAAVVACFSARGLLARDDALRDRILTGPAREGDTYLRQAATILLARACPATRISGWLQSSDAATRLAAVLAAGFRLTLPECDVAPAEGLPLTPWKNTHVDYADARIDLQTLGRMGTFTVAEHWKAGAHSPEQELLFGTLRAALADGDERVRLQAASFLFLLEDPRTEPTIARVREEARMAQLARAEPAPITAAWMIGPVDDAATGGWGKPNGLERSFDPKATAAAPGGGKAAWRRAEAGADGAFALPSEDASAATSTALFMRIESPTPQPVQLLVDADAAVVVTLNGTPIQTTAAGPSSGGATVATTLKQGGNDLWVRVRGTVSPGRLSLRTRTLERIVVDLPEPLTGMSLAERLAANGGKPVDPASLLALDWQAEAARGNPLRGKRLFAADGLGCAKCHAMSPDASGNAGPSLAAAGRRFTVEYIVESVLTPSKTIAPIFKATTVITNDGRSQTGLIVGETGEAVELLLSDASQVRIPLADIDERVVQDVSPMPAGLVQTADEMRDIVAYLMQSAR
jgi:putative heme-binding domain-containing protein